MKIIVKKVCIHYISKKRVVPYINTKQNKKEIYQRYKIKTKELVGLKIY